MTKRQAPPRPLAGGWGTFTLAATLLVAAQFLPSLAEAQKTRNAAGTPPATVPLRRYPMLGDSTFLPGDIAVRSLKGVKGFEKYLRRQGSNGRVQIGGVNGAPVIDQVVNLTQTTNYAPVGVDPVGLIDKRTPTWSQDERFLYFAGTTVSTPNRYNLFRISSQDPTEIGSARSDILTNPADTGFDYYFPALNQNQTRIAFVRSSDGKGIDDPSKRFDLFVSDLPQPGQFINTATLGNTNLRDLTSNASLSFTNGAGGRGRFVNVGRMAFVGSTEVVFAAQLGDNDPANDDQERRTLPFHIFSINIQSVQIFQLTAGNGDERNPQVSPDGRFIAFDSNAAPQVENPADPASTAYNNTGTRVRTEQDQAAQPAAARALSANNVRNVFTMTALGQNVRQFTQQYTGAVAAVSSFHPTWTSSQSNNFTNTNALTYYIGFASTRIPTFAAGDTTQSTVTGYAAGPTDRSSIYYAPFTRNGGSVQFVESTPGDRDNVGSDGARRIDTANTTRRANQLEDLTAPRFRDLYPTFAPFINVFRVGFQSNRTGDLNFNGFGPGFTPTATNNIFIASVIDITAPTLIRYDTSNPVGAIMNLNLVTDQNNPYNPNQNVRSRADGITPGSEVFFTVRIEDRETGLRPENSADGGAVFLQIKNPNSRYQTLQQSGVLVNDATRGEHKEFISNGRIRDLDDPNDFGTFFGSPEGAWVAIVNNARYPWTVVNSGGPTSPYLPTNYNVGHEFECQAISAFSSDPTIARGGLQGSDAAGAVNSLATDRQGTGSNYFSHIGNSYSDRNGDGVLYVPSLSDAQAFAGLTMPPLDGLAHPRRGRIRPVITTVTTKNVWLRLEPLVQRDAAGTPIRDANGNTIPVRPPDNRGGVLYGAKWRTPTEASDWYIDVIAYDNAVNPFDTTSRSNVIIYDNVWGFSTAPAISGQPTDILVVSDYTLGQKFFQSRFGQLPTDDESTQNQLPLFYGAESYYTDTDLRRFASEALSLPSAPGTGTNLPTWGYFIDTQTNSLFNGTPFFVAPTIAPGGVNGGTIYNQSNTPNVLGPGGYNDEQLSSGAVIVDNGLPGALGGIRQYALPPTARYNIWRILSRGPVPQALLQDYLPQITTSPGDTTKNETRPRNVINAQRCVVWATPFSGNLFVGAGTITDISAQDALTAFVQGGGRLFISGQDIGYAIGRNGDNRFYNDILRANFVNDAGGSGTTGLIALTPANAAFTGYTRQFTEQPWNSAIGTMAYAILQPPVPRPYTPLNASGPGANAQIRYYNRSDTPNDVGDSSPVASSGSYLDSITPRPSTAGGPDSVALFNYTGGATAAIVSALPNGATPVGEQLGYSQTADVLVPQGRAVYMAAGFESVSQGWYNVSNAWLTMGRRTQMMNNIVESFRTGTITGKIIDNDGRPVNDALVRAILNVADESRDAYGTAITDDNGNFQIVGLPPGFYVLYGTRPGFYTQHNTGNSVHGGWRVTSELTLKRAGPGALSGIQSGTGTNSFGGVFGEDGVTPIPNIEIQLRRREVNGTITLITARSSDGTTTVFLPDGTRTTLPPGAYLLPSLLIGEYQVYANSRQTVRNGVVVNKTPEEIAATVNRAYGEIRIGVSPTSTYRIGTGTTIVTDPAGQPVPPNTFRPVLQINEGRTSQIDFLLPATPQQITGRVVDQDTNAGIAGAVVAAQRNGVLFAQGTTDANGNYTLSLVTATGAPNPDDLTQLPGGTYTITGNANGYSTTSPPSERPTVTASVGGSLNPVVTAQEIRLKKLPPGSVSGLVRRNNGTTQSTTGVAGATVTFFAVTVVGDAEVQSETPAYTTTVAATPTADGTYVYNFRIADINPGIYNAYISQPGLTGNPVRQRVVITSGAETRNVNFSLEPPRIYGAGIQLISLPTDFSTVPSRSVFGLDANGDNDGNGTVNGNDQNIFNQFNVADWLGDRYNISPEIPFRLGKGYFVRFASTAAVARSGNAVTTPTFTIDLLNGWNLIGHPFTNQENPSIPPADIDLSSASVATFSYVTAAGETRSNVALAQAVADNAVQSQAYFYTGSLQGGQYVQATFLRPYFGYWFRAFVPVQLTLRYPGGATRGVRINGIGSIRASKADGGKFTTITRAQSEKITQRSIESRGATDWRIQIAARQGDLLDTDNSVGVAPDAKDGFDNRYDHEKPPMVTEAPGVYVAIDGKTADGRSVELSDNLQSPEQSRSWTFSVRSTADSTTPVTVYWPNIGRLPRNVEPVLIEEATGKRIDMRSGSSSFQFTPKGRSVHRFRLEISRAASLPLDIVNLRAIRNSRALGAGSGYQFRFSTTRAVDVTAELKTVTGRSLRTLRTRAAAGAEASLAWDGRDNAGNQIPPGAYVLNLTVRDEKGAKATRSVMVMSLE